MFCAVGYFLGSFLEQKATIFDDILHYIEFKKADTIKNKNLEKWLNTAVFQGLSLWRPRRESNPRPFA